jgi:hypothetical protein
MSRHRNRAEFASSRRTALIVEWRVYADIACFFENTALPFDYGKEVFIAEEVTSDC